MTFDEVMLRREIRRLQQHIEELAEENLLLQHLVDVQGHILVPVNDFEQTFDLVLNNNESDLDISGEVFGISMNDMWLF